MTHFFLKPGQSGQPVSWPGEPGSDIPGPSNFGTEEKPVLFSAGAVTEWIYKVQDPAMTFHFEPGDYTVGPASIGGQYIQGADYVALQPNPSMPGRMPRLHFLGNPVRLPVLRNYSHNYTKAQTDAWLGGVERAILWSHSGSAYVDHIQVEYLAFDDNFLGMGYPATKGAITRGFKLFALQLRAKTGIVRGCTVTNSGSSSDMIGGSLANEAFPINVYAIEPKENAWAIVNCTVSNFHSRNGGYATMITPCMFTTHSDDELYACEDEVDEWFACVVQGCMVNGVPQVNGLGSSGAQQYASSRILFADNVVRNCGLGSNNDTASVVRQHYIRNSFLDVCGMIQLGTPTTNPTFHRNFLIENNYARIKGLNDAEVAPGWPVKRCGLHIRNNARGVLFRDNTLDHGKAEYFNGDYLRVVNLSGDDGYYPEYYGSAGPTNTDIDDWIGEDRAKGSLIRGMVDKSTPDERVCGKIGVSNDGRWTVI